jgi:hypothetical protein
MMFSRRRACLPCTQLFGYTSSIGIRPVVEISYCPGALRGACNDATDAYHGFICAPSLSANWSKIVPLPPELAQLQGTPEADFARGNMEYGRMVKEAVAHLVKTFGLEEIRRWKFE